MCQDDTIQRGVKLSGRGKALQEKTISEILLKFPTADETLAIDILLLATMRRVLLRDFHLRLATESPSEELPTPIDDQ